MNVTSLEYIGRHQINTNTLFTKADFKNFISESINDDELSNITVNFVSVNNHQLTYIIQAFDKNYVENAFHIIFANGNIVNVDFKTIDRNLTSFSSKGIITYTNRDRAKHFINLLHIM